jgi:hypothetical protein
MSLLGSTAAVWPLVARQQAAMPVIGLLYVRSPEDSGLSSPRFVGQPLNLRGVVSYR